MSSAPKAAAFTALHAKGDPLVLVNIWDAGSARCIADAGAKALATGSWSVAAAQGYADGEQLPLDLLAMIIGRITATTNLPLSVDLEGGYGVSPETVAATLRRLLPLGIVGINFEDGIVGGTGLHPVDAHCKRIAALRAEADAFGVPLFINARTDLFLQAPADGHAGLIAAALERAAAYAEAGASGFFAPGLADRDLIAHVCTEVALPVNIMMTRATPDLPTLRALGVARASFGPGPYRDMQTYLTDVARRHL